MLSDSISDLAKCLNPKTCTFTFMHFPVGALFEVLNLIGKHFLIRNFITILKKNRSVVVHI